MEATGVERAKSVKVAVSAHQTVGRLRDQVDALQGALTSRNAEVTDKAKSFSFDAKATASLARTDTGSGRRRDSGNGYDDNKSVSGVEEEVEESEESEDAAISDNVEEEDSEDN